MDNIVYEIELAARGAGEIVRNAHGLDLGIENKEGRANFVTKYDTMVQDYLVNRLGKILPEARFLGEESGLDQFQSGADKGYLFVIDPIDGTTNFIHNMHPHVVSIGLFKDGVPWAGVVYAPATDELFSAQKGQGAYENGCRIHSSTRPLSENIMLVGSSGFSLEAYSISQKMAFEFQSKCQGIRSLGSSEYSLCMIASGRVGGYTEMRLGLWDFAAGSVILEEAGGTVTDFYRRPLTYREGCGIVALCKGIAQDPQMPDTGAYMTLWSQA